MTRRYKLTKPLVILRPGQGTDVALSAAQTKPDDDEDDHEGSNGASAPENDTTIHERPVFIPSKDTEVMQAVGLRRQYLRDTGVSSYMNNLTTTLLKSDSLPYNPYPGFVKRLSKVSEKFHTRRKSLIQVQQQMSQSRTFVTGTGVISGVKMPEIKLWGLQHIMMVVNPKKLMVLRDIVKSGTIERKKLAQKVKSVSMISSLKGSCIFFGSVHNTCLQFNVSETVVVTSTDINDAAYKFGEAVFTDLAYIFNETSHIILSLDVAVMENQTLIKKTWLANDLEPILTADSSSSIRNELVKAIGFAAVKKQECLVGIIFSTGDNSSNMRMKSIKGSKIYSFIGIIQQMVVSQGRSQSKEFFSTTLPYQALHEGVFLEQSEAETYLTTYRKNSSDKSPLQQSVTNEINKHWQQKIAGRLSQSDIILITHYLMLMDRLQSLSKPLSSKKEDSLTIETYRISQGLGITIENISLLTTVLYDILSSKFDETSKKLINDILMQYQDLLMEFFDEKSHELTISYAKNRLLHACEEIKLALKGSEIEKSKSLLNFSKGYLKALSIGLVDDALEEFPNTVETLALIDNAFLMKFGIDLQTDTSIDKYRHKSESISHVDVAMKNVDMSILASGIPVPTYAAPQSARIQYCIDLRVDQIWESFLHDLFITRDNPPPNPYPSLIKLLREASLKMQLYKDDVSAVVRKFLATKPKIVDEYLYLYTVGVPAFGIFSAVSMINSNGFKQVSSIALSAAVSPQSGSGSLSFAAGAYEMRCFSAISGESILYNSASPYLSSLSTEEHCFIRGPDKQQADGLTAFAKLIITYIRSMIEKGMLPTRVIFSDSEIELAHLDDVINTLQSQISQMLTTKKPLVLHLLMPKDWRYLLIRKVFHLYYINEMTDNVSTLTKQDSSQLHQQVFFSSADAIEYAKRTNYSVKKPKSFFRKKVLKCAEEYEWSGLALSTLQWSLYGGGTDKMDQSELEIASFAWALFHSPYGFLSYANGLNDALRECVLYGSSMFTSDAHQKMVVSMLFGYRNCIHTVLSSQSSMVSPALNSYCQNLLQNSAPCNATTFTAAISKQLPAVLQHINSIFTALGDCISDDLLRTSPSLLKLMK